jgi:drug/metabolite transporter (DMT)-like permease
VKNWKVYTALTLAIIFWGFSFAGTRYCLGILHPIWLVFFRLSISVIFLFALMLITRSFRKIAKEDIKYFLLLSFLEPLIYFMGETYGIRLVSSLISSVIIATIPLFVAIGGIVFLKKKPGWQIVTGIVLSMTGVSLLVVRPDMSFSASPLGIMLLFVAVFSAVGYTLIVYRLVKKYSPLEIIAWENFIGIILFVPFLFFNDPVSLPAADYTLAIIMIVLLGIFPSSLSYMFFNWGVKVLGVNRASIFTNAIPVVTAVLAYFWLKEEITWQNLLGMFIVISSLTFTQITSGEK